MANLTPRLTTMKGQWAKTAQTGIPVPPVPGTAYRNTALSVPEIESGQAYDKVYDSARHNEMLHQATGMALEVSEYGLPRYSELTDYKEGGLCLGLDGSLYQAVQANGPGTAGVGVKGTDQAAYWKNIPIESLGEIKEKADAALTEAPEDGKLYGRKDGDWEEVTGSGEEGAVEEAPKDGKTYGRKDGDWAEVGGGIADAPADNQKYGRINNAWSVINEGAEPGGGGVEEAPNNANYFVRGALAWHNLAGVLTGLGYQPGGGGGGGTGLAAFSAGAFTGPMSIPSLGSGTRYAWFGHFFNSGESGTQEFAAGTTQSVNGHNGSAGYDSGQGIWIAYIPA